MTYIFLNALRMDRKGDGKPCGKGFINRNYHCSDGKRKQLAADLKAGDEGARKRVEIGKRNAKERQSLKREVQRDKGKKAKVIEEPTASLKSIRANELNKSEEKELSDLAKRISSGEIDAYEARSMAKSGKVAEALTRGNIAAGNPVQKKRSAKEASSDPASSSNSKLGSARRAEQQAKESTPKRRGYDPATRIGSAAKLAEGKPIKSQSDFDREIDKAFDLINKEKKAGDMIPIAALRDAIGERVSQQDFDKYFKESSLREGYQSIGGETSGALGYSAKEVIASEYKTPLGGRRFYLQRNSRKDSYIHLDSLLPHRNRQPYRNPQP